MRLPRLLAGVDGSGAVSLHSHLTIHGPLPSLTARRRQSSPSLIEDVRRSGLTGRGGGGFPTATKLESVRAARGRPIVVVNGCEGEPASQKDRVLIEHAPHLVIDGALTCAQATGADRIVFAVDADAPATGAGIGGALAERGSAETRGLSIEILAVPPGYVSGQETAIVNFVNHGLATPTSVPPMVFERGLARRPTLVSNAETIAQVGLIARHGPDWFREVGTSADPGSTLITLTGAIAQPGVFEIESGALLESVIRSAGGPVSPIRAVLLGGYGGTWVEVSRAGGLALAASSLRAAGATLGPGVVLALPDTACPVAETARVAAWMSNQSARQCGPCVHGLAAIAARLADVADGRGGHDAGERLAGWAGLVTGRGACAHPDGAARFVTSALRVFADEFADHARYGRCEACSHDPVLPLPYRLPLAA
jgi:NADH:ubiquinone oxidoreductase subunit F (NADH-binding)